MNVTIINAAGTNIAFGDYVIPPGTMAVDLQEGTYAVNTGGTNTMTVEVGPGRFGTALIGPGLVSMDEAGTWIWFISGASLGLLVYGWKWSMNAIRSGIEGGSRND